MPPKTLHGVAETQRLVIGGWLPEQTANGPHGHWSARHRAHERAMVKTYQYAMANGWRRATGPARLDIVLVFGCMRRRDTDNLYARCKGLIDGLVKGGYLLDDDTEHLDLHVSARVETGKKRVELTLSGDDGSWGCRYGRRHAADVGMCDCPEGWQEGSA